MHRTFERLLASADGASVPMIVAFFDIRGFTEFSQRRQAHDTAMFVKRVYRWLLDRFAADSLFWKPTGDGMLFAFPFVEANTIDRSIAITVRALDACQSFAGAFAKEPVLAFQLPQALGCGITRGCACVLRSGETILDLSGDVVNLAARLTSEARPAGVVLDSGMVAALHGNPIADRFQLAQVYLRGVAETTPITVGYEAARVLLDPRCMAPIGVEPVVVVERKFLTVASLIERENNLSIVIPCELSEPARIQVELCVARDTKPGVQAEEFSFITLSPALAKYRCDFGEPLIVVDRKLLAADLKRLGISPSLSAMIVARGFVSRANALKHKLSARTSQPVGAVLRPASANGQASTST